MNKFILKKSSMFPENLISDTLEMSELAPNLVTLPTCRLICQRPFSKLFKRVFFKVLAHLQFL